MESTRHPYVVLFHLGFRIAALVVYLFCGWFSDGFIASFVFTIILLSLDFWTVKNITGNPKAGSLAQHSYSMNNNRAHLGWPPLVELRWQWGEKSLDLRSKKSTSFSHTYFNFSYLSFKSIAGGWSEKSTCCRIKSFLDSTDCFSSGVGYSVYFSFVPFQLPLVSPWLHSSISEWSQPLWVPQV